MSEKEKLTEKQEKFCIFCAEEEPPEQAAVLAGYSSAKQAGTLLKAEKIRQEILRLRKEALPQGVAGKDDILRFLTGLMQDEAETDIKTRIKAAELLGKQAGLFEKETEDRGRSSVVIVDDVP